MSNQTVPNSPVPDTVNERTRLLDTTTSTTTYSHQEESSSTSQTVIKMSHEENGGPVFHTCSSEGKPTLPVHQLTDKIQDILVFSEIKQVQEEKRQYRALKKDQEQQEVASPEQDSSSDDEDIKSTLKRKMSEYSIASSKDSGRLRKRDMAVDALKFATESWKKKHGWASTSSSEFVNTNTGGQYVIENMGHQQNKSTGKSGPTVIQPIPVTTPAVPSASGVFEVAKHASVCAVLALLHERRQSSGLTAETDLSLQNLALTTLTLGLKGSDTKQLVLHEMLVMKWMNGRSALELAVENDSQIILNDPRVQRVIEDLWTEGPDWTQDPSHPSQVWKSKNKTPEGRRKGILGSFIGITFFNYLARWSSPRYQSYVRLIVGLFYLGFHLASATNVEYVSDDLHSFEYFYYVLVVSDMLLELYKLVFSPFVYLRKVSSYLSLLTVGLLISSFVLRVVSLVAIHSIEIQVYYLNISFALLILATPLMFFRLLACWSNNLCWSIAKMNYTIEKCVQNSLWVFGLGIFVIVSFWVALGALQYEDVRPFTMLRHLLLGALHAPQIGATLYYQPTIAGILLIVYLFLTMIIFTALLIASFLSTLLDLNGQYDKIRRDWIIQRCLTPAQFNVLLPTVIIDLVFGTVSLIARKLNCSVVWIEKLHQVIWYIVYSPIILVLGLFELVKFYCKKVTLFRAR